MVVLVRTCPSTTGGRRTWRRAWPGFSPRKGTGPWFTASPRRCAARQGLQLGFVEVTRGTAVCAVAELVLIEAVVTIVRNPGRAHANPMPPLHPHARIPPFFLLLLIIIILPLLLLFLLLFFLFLLLLLLLLLRRPLRHHLHIFQIAATAAKSKPWPKRTTGYRTVLSPDGSRALPLRPLVLCVAQLLLTNTEIRHVFVCVCVEPR